MKAPLKSTQWAILAACLIGLQISMPTAQAVEVDGLQLPDTYTLNGQTYVLNGAGTRFYSIFKVKVYSAGLYLTHKTQDAQAVLNSPDTKIVRLEMRVDSKREDNQKAWKHYLEANCQPPCSLKPNSLMKFMQLQTNLHAGDTETYVFEVSGLSVLRNDKPIETIADPQFARIVLASWIGQVPSTESLKVQLLGSK